MNPPTIADAQAVAKKLRARGVIILAFGADGYAGASYGWTRELCRKTGAVLDQIGDMIDCGDVELPEGLCGAPAAEAGGEIDLSP